MKRRMMLMLCCSVVLSLFFGCSDDSNVAPTPNKPTTAPTTPTTESQTQDGLVQQELRIFGIKEREWFERFLASPSSDLLELQATYPQEKGFHATMDVTLFPIDENFVRFANNTNGAVQEFFEQNGVSCTVKETTLFEAPSVPMVIWVKTDDGDYYVTIDEEPADEVYTYRLYTSKEFVKKFSCKEATVYIGDEPIETSCPAKMYHDYEDIPLVAVLKALGAQVEWQDELCAYVSFCGREYELKLDSPVAVCKKGGDSNFLEELTGGRFYTYAQGQELMLDSASFLYVMRCLGQPVSLSGDRDHAKVLIEPINVELPSVTTTAESFEFSELSEYIYEYDEITNVGTVLTEEEAIECAKILWDTKYGMMNGQPYDPTGGEDVLVRYNEELHCWWVYGTLPPKTKGSVPAALIQTDGNVIAVFWY